MTFEVRARGAASLLTAMVGAIALMACSGQDAPMARETADTVSGSQIGLLDEASAGAINDVFSREGPQAVRLGAGEYRLREGLSLGSRNSLTGAGAGVTVLKMTGRGEYVVGNRDAEAGNEHITLSGLTIDCNGRASVGGLFRRTASLTVTNVEFHGCEEYGLRISGDGRPTRGVFLDNLDIHHNGLDGMTILWATRESLYTNIRSHSNARMGIIIDHSEGMGANLLADENGGNGIFLRNLFAGSYTNIAATRNGRHGILVQGFVSSVGTGWRAQANSRARPGVFDEVFLAANAELSYGVSRQSVIEGLVVGGFNDLGPASARYGVSRQDGTVDISLSGVVHGETREGEICKAGEPCAKAGKL